MARPLHHEEAGATFHVTSHSVDEGVIVRTERDRKIFLETVAETVLRYQWVCLAVYVFDNHFHLLVVTPNANLAAGMQFLKGTYAQAFNRRHKRRGALFRERYRRKRVLTDAHLMLTVRYIALNGVAAGVLDDPRIDHRSSYPAVVGAQRPWPFVARAQLLALFGTRKTALRRLVAFVEGPQRTNAGPAAVAQPP